MASKTSRSVVDACTIRIEKFRKLHHVFHEMTSQRIVFAFNETITRFHDVRIVITLVLLTDRLSFRVQ